MTPPSRQERDGDITRLLELSASGEITARDDLATLLHQEIHSMAMAQMRGERRGHTLGATALVNETFLRLFGSADRAEGDLGITWTNRRTFFVAAATAMRRVLIDHARSRMTEKRGGGPSRRRLDIEADALAAAQTLEPSQFLDLDKAMNALANLDARAAEVTRLRVFAGLDVSQIAELLDVSDRTIKRDWQFARAWLRGYLNTDGAGGDQAADVS